MATSWTDTRPVREDSWATPHEQWPVPAVLLACAAVGVLLAAVLIAGQTAMCAMHATPTDPAPLSYCGSPTTSEDTP
jgi:hypothetical protein